MADETFENVMVVVGEEPATPTPPTGPPGGRPTPRGPAGPSTPVSSIPEEQLDGMRDDIRELFTRLRNIGDKLDSISERIEERESYAPDVSGLSGDISELTDSINELRASSNTLPDELRDLINGTSDAVNSLSEEIKGMNKSDPALVNQVNTLQRSLDGMERSIRNVATIVRSADIPKVQSEIEGVHKTLQEGFDAIIDSFNANIRELREDIETMIQKKPEQNKQLLEIISMIEGLGASLTASDERIQRMYDYFVQIREQNMPWQEKVFINKAKDELKAVLETITTQEKEINEKVSGFKETLNENVNKIKDTADEIQKATKAYYQKTITKLSQIAVEKQHQFNELVGAHKRNMDRIIHALEHIVEELLEEDVKAGEIGNLTTRIITELGNALTALREVNAMAPQLDAQMRSLGSEINKWMMGLENIKDDLIVKKPIKIGVPVSAAPEKPTAPSVREDLYLRVSANHAKLGFLSKLDYAMPQLIEGVKTIKKTFDFLYGFYANFKIALESNDRATITKYSSIEKKQLIEHIRFFINLVWDLRDGSRRAKSDFAKLKNLVAKSYSDTGNRYFAHDNMILALPKGIHPKKPEKRLTSRRPARTAYPEEVPSPSWGDAEFYQRVESNDRKLWYMSEKMTKFSTKRLKNYPIQQIFDKAIGCYLELKRGIEAHDEVRINIQKKWEEKNWDKLGDLNEFFSDFLKKAEKGSKEEQEEVKDYREYLKKKYDKTANPNYQKEMLVLV